MCTLLRRCSCSTRRTGASCAPAKSSPSTKRAPRTQPEVLRVVQQGLRVVSSRLHSSAAEFLHQHTAVLEGTGEISLKPDASSAVRLSHLNPDNMLRVLMRLCLSSRHEKTRLLGTLTAAPSPPSAACARRLPQFKEHNTNVVGASVDSVYCHQAWVTTPQKQARLLGMSALSSDPVNELRAVLNLGLGYVYSTGVGSREGFRSGLGKGLCEG